jgi:hypothetical protein
MTILLYDRLLRFIPASLAALLFAHSAHAIDRHLINAIETTAGVYASIGIHELGHAVVAKAFGATDVKIEIPAKGSMLSGVTRSTFPRPLARGQDQVLSASGLIAANLAGEIVIRREQFHDSRFAQSLLGGALASNLVHVYTYYTNIRGKSGYGGNDIDHFEMAGGNPHVYSVALVAYSAWTLQRMRKEGIPLFFVSLRF